MSIMDSYERACVAASAKSIGDLAKKTAQGLKPTPTGDPICGACKHWGIEQQRAYFNNALIAPCKRNPFYGTNMEKACVHTAVITIKCFELWEEET